MYRASRILLSNEISNKPFFTEKLPTKGVKVASHLVGVGAY